MKDTLKKAFKTFIQAAVGFIVANLTVTNTSLGSKDGYLKYTILTLICSAVAFGLSAVMNIPKNSKLKCKLTKNENGEEEFSCELNENNESVTENVTKEENENE